jgi:hypothetical protein
LQMDTRYLERMPHISSMTVWHSSVIMDTFWMAVVKFVAKPITPGILKYQFVKKVKAQQGFKKSYLFTYYCLLFPSQSQSHGKWQGGNRLFPFFPFCNRMFYAYCVFFV